MIRIIRIISRISESDTSFPSEQLPRREWIGIDERIKEEEEVL